MKVLSGKTALITGAAGGIGRALVQQFVAAGARVVMADLASAAAPCAGLQDDNCRFVATDVSDEQSVQRCITQTVETFGSLDILVNNAAVLWPTAALQETSNDEFEKLIAVNLRGVFWGCKYSYPHLKKARGCVLNISSMAGVHGEKGHAMYSLTKGAINAVTQSMAIDWGADGIRCNALCPSSVLTPSVDAAIAAQANASEIVELRKNTNVLGYTAQPEEIASAALFLVSPAASFITGAVLPVSGGSECGYGLKY